MKHLIILSIAILLLSASLSCSQTGSAKNSPQITLVATTPGDAGIKKTFGIAPETAIDMVRWEVVLNAEKTFSLTVVYGESKPNTRGMITETKISLGGKYEIAKQDKKEIYRLKSEKPQVNISLAKMNDNLFHLLTADDKLMIGNGGWSYTLNRKIPVENAALPVLAAAVTDSTPAQIIFQGRTPCDIAPAFKITVPEGCFKLKWGITLNRDPKTAAPSTYSMRRIDHRLNELQGTWTIEKGTGANAGAIIYKLDPDKPDQSISFVLADENVLFFLDKNGRPLTGNEEFSYTLDKKTN